MAYAKAGIYRDCDASDTKSSRAGSTTFELNELHESGQLPIARAGSTGRCNTRSTPTRRALAAKGRSQALIQTKHPLARSAGQVDSLEGNIAG